MWPLREVCVRVSGRNDGVECAAEADIVQRRQFACDGGEIAGGALPEQSNAPPIAAPLGVIVYDARGQLRVQKREDEDFRRRE